GDGIRGFIPGNGAATIENTYGCRADKTGALVPLNHQYLTFAPTTAGIPTDNYGLANRPASRVAAYVLDAEISAHRFYGGANYGFGAHDYSVFVMWGSSYAPDDLGATLGYYPYVLGREYILNPLFAQWELDFMFAKWNTRPSGA